MKIFGSRVVVHVGKKLAQFFANNYHAILAPKAVRAKKEMEAVGKAVEVAEKMSAKEQDDIKFAYKMYRKLGLSDDEIKDKLVDRIETAQDPLARISKLHAQGFLKRINVKRQDNENQ